MWGSVEKLLGGQEKLSDNSQETWPDQVGALGFSLTSVCCVFFFFLFLVHKSWQAGRIQDKCHFPSRDSKMQRLLKRFLTILKNPLELCLEKHLSVLPLQPPPVLSPAWS